MVNWAKLILLIPFILASIALKIEMDVTIYPKQQETMVGEIIVGDKTFEVVYHNNLTSQSFLEQMPFTTVMKDYAGKEKIFDPIEVLSKQNPASGAKPVAGDIMCYGPWGNIAIFYKEAPYASGLIPMGHINEMESFIEALQDNDFKATFKKRN